MKINNITLYSSFAKDRIFNQKNILIREQIGGPAYYIVKALKNVGMQVTLPLPQWFDVDIMVTDTGEFGKVKTCPQPIEIPKQSSKVAIVCISTISNEYSFNSINKCTGTIFFDIQGYVRNEKTYGAKKFLDYPPKAFKNVYCLKGTEEEMSYVQKDVITRQKKKLLLITKGSNGSVLYANNKIFEVRPSIILQPDNTLGAGDTLFACFIAGILQNYTPDKALVYATNETINFLKDKPTIV